MAAKAEANAAKTARTHANNSEHKAKLKQKTERTPSLYSGMLHGGNILVVSVKRRRQTTWRPKQSMRNNAKSLHERQARKGDRIMCLGCCLAVAMSAALLPRLRCADLTRGRWRRELAPRAAVPNAADRLGLCSCSSARAGVRGGACHVRASSREARAWPARGWA